MKVSDFETSKKKNLRMCLVNFKKGLLAMLEIVVHDCNREEESLILAFVAR